MVHSKNFKDITGLRSGKIIATSFSHINKQRSAMWNCRCDCGGESRVQGSAITNGRIASCGCSKMKIPNPNKIFYTYIHKRETDGAVFYVGMSKNKYRINQKHNRSAAWHEEVLKSGIKAEICGFFDTIEEARSAEIELIKMHSDQGSPLCNITKGGGGALGRKITEEARMSMVGKNNPQFGRIGFFTGRQHSEKTKKLISQKNKRHQVISTT